jgi:hypothetical protein
VHRAKIVLFRSEEEGEMKVPARHLLVTTLLPADTLQPGSHEAR